MTIRIKDGNTELELQFGDPSLTATIQQQIKYVVTEFLRLKYPPAVDVTPPKA